MFQQSAAMVLVRREILWRFLQFTEEQER